MDEKTKVHREGITERYLRTFGAEEVPDWTTVKNWYIATLERQRKARARRQAEYLAMKDLKLLHRKDWLNLVHQHRDSLLAKWDRVLPDYLED